MSDQKSPLVNRLAAERTEAHRRYNEALTAVDGAIQRLPDWPSPPAPYDEQMLPGINDAWKIVPDGGPAPSSGWRPISSGAAWQLVAPLFERQMAFNAALVDHLNRNAAAHRESREALAIALPAARQSFEELVRFESLLLQFLQRITPLADAGDREVRDAIEGLRSVAEVAQRSAAMAAREIKRLSTAPHPALQTTAPASPPATGQGDAAITEASKYLGFEDRFRGSEDEIRARLTGYVAYFEGSSNVLDVGCGRGEFLDLLREHGVSAKGIDVNPEMVEACKARGLDVSTADALGALQGMPDESLGGLIAVQVVEHLKPAYLSQFLQLAFYKLRPGSRIVLETINPACWVAFFESYIRDLTHEKPIHPETLQYLLQASGFTSVDVVYRSPIAEGGRLQRVTPPAEHFGQAVLDPVAELASAFNHNMDRLNGRLFTFQDYAAVARVPEGR